MNGFLKQSTASQSRLIGPFVDDTDFKTAETGLTIANTDIKLRANGTTLSNKNSGGGTHQVNGMYSVTWDATDTANVGELYFSVVVSGALQVFGSYFVLEEAVYDALFAASAPGYGTAQTGDSFARLGAPAGASVSADIAAIEAQTDDIGAAGAGLTAIPWNSAWDAEVESEVDDALGGGTGTALTSIPWNSAWDAEVQSEAEDAIVAHRLDELLNADSDIDGAAPPTVGSVFHELMTKTAGSFTYDQATDSNEAIRDNMGTAQTGDSFARLGAPAGASVSADIAAIEAQTDDIGAAGAGLSAIPWNAAWDAEVESEATDALNAYDPPTKAELDAAQANVSVDEIQASALADLFNTDSGTTYGAAVAGSPVKEIADNAGGSGLTAGAIADAVWDEAIAGHLAAGSTGAKLNSAASAGDPWSTALPGAYAAGEAGNILGNLKSDLGAKGVTLSGPLNPVDQSLTLVKGDDYTVANGQAPVWTDSGGTWPSLTGTTIEFRATRPGGTDYVEAATVVDANTVRCEFTAAETSDVTKLGVATSWSYHIRITAPYVLTLVDGTLTVEPTPSP